MPRSKRKGGKDKKTVNCSVLGCKNKKRFHFPKDETLRAKWLKAIRREDFNPGKKVHGLCMDHFNPDDMIGPTDPDQPKERTLLRCGSIPSIFPWNQDPQYEISGTVDCYEEVVMCRPEDAVDAEYSTDTKKNSDHSVAAYEVSLMDVSSSDNEETVMSENGSTACGTTIMDHLGYCLTEESSYANRKMTSFVGTKMHHSIDMPTETQSHECYENSEECTGMFGRGEQMLVDCYEEVIPPQSHITDRVNSGFQSSNEERMEEVPPSNNNSTANKNPNARYSIEQFKEQPDMVLHFTGLESYEKFELVLNILGPAAFHLKYVRELVGNISVPDQFFLVLWKLRRNECDMTLGAHFGIDRLAVGNIFITWILFMSQHFALLDIWPSRDLVDFFQPESFKQNYPATRVIIDGTEFEIERPSDPRAQQSSFSNYKNKNTCKGVIGCTGGGLISYCSPFYGGSTSDRQIVERSDLMKKCDPGDIVMADKGFTVQDLFAPYNVTCLTPTFVRKGYSPHGKVIRDRQLAKHRIHIERVIGLIKTFTILTSKLNHSYVPLASEIVQVCVMLSNFKENIMKPKKERNPMTER